MTVGLAATTLANKWLDMLAATAFTAPVASYVQLHTADPGAAGTTSVFSSVVTARSSASWSAASAGSKAISNVPTWTANGAGTVTHISWWDASSSGNYLFSAVLSASKTVASGDVINLTTFTISFTPIAA